VTAACLAELGHEIVGVDIQAAKAQAVNAGRAPLLEPGLDELIAANVRAGRLRATTAAVDAIAQSDLALICVGTPAQPNGSVNLMYVERVARAIGGALRGRAKPFTFVVRSTCPPGTLERAIKPLLRDAAQRDIPVAVNPEFMREGSAVRDFFAPPFILIGAADTPTAEMLRALYAGVEAPPLATEIATAEAVKYASNAFHAVKVVFANEIGRWCASQNVDSRAVMEIFCADRALNLSEKYLTPGFAFGGSCLPKDVRALLYQARHSDAELPLLNAVLPSNHLQVQRAFDLIVALGKTRLALLGLTFTANTDDVRESPMVLLAEQLLGKGYKLAIHDPQLSLARVMGANRAYLERHLPHIASLLVPSVETALAASEVVVLGQKASVAVGLDLRAHIVVDLVGALSHADARELLRVV